MLEGGEHFAPGLRRVECRRVAIRDDKNRPPFSTSTKLLFLVLVVYHFYEVSCGSVVFLLFTRASSLNFIPLQLYYISCCCRYVSFTTPTFVILLSLLNLENYFYKVSNRFFVNPRK